MHNASTCARWLIQQATWAKLSGKRLSTSLAQLWVFETGYATLFYLCNIIVICYRNRKNTPVWLFSSPFKVLCEVHSAAAASRRQTIVWVGGTYCAIHRCTLGWGCFHLVMIVWSGVEREMRQRTSCLINPPPAQANTVTLHSHALVSFKKFLYYDVHVTFT